MPDLGLIWFWPAGGRLIDRQEDAFVRSAGRICALYSEAIEKYSLPAKFVELRWFAHHGGAADRATVHVYLDPPMESFDSATVDLPDEVADLAPDVRGRLVSEVIHAGLVGMHTARGWDLAALHAAHEEVIASGGEFVRPGAWKVSPGRGWRARAVYRLDDDGDGKTHIEAETYPDPDQKWRSLDVLDAPTYEGFQRWTELRWVGPNLVRLTTAPRGPVHGPITVELDLHTSAPSPPPTKVPLPPLPPLHGQTVVVETHEGGVGVSRPEARLGGGGPTNDVPEAYLEASGLLSEWVEDELLGWWSGSTVNLWSNLWDYSPAKTTRPYVRLTGHRLSTRVRHPMPDPAVVADPVGRARADMLSLLEAVRRRLDLPTPPIDLPSTETLREQADRTLARRRREDDQLLELINGLAGRLPAWLIRSLVKAVEMGTSGDAINGLHINLTERGVVLTSEEQHVWKQLTHPHTD